MESTPLLTKIARIFYPRFLRCSETGQLWGQLTTYILKKSFTTLPVWKPVEKITLLPGSTLRYIGLVKNIKAEVEAGPNDSIFELVSPKVEKDFVNPQSIAPGDTIFVASTDRQYIWPLTRR